MTELKQIEMMLETLSKEELTQLIETSKEQLLKIKMDEMKVEECPHCGSKKFIRYGKNKFGKQRYHCECGKIFLATTNTITHGTWKTLGQWELFLHHYVIGSSLEVCARECNISENTANRWRHKVSMALYLNQETVILSGVVELDETLINRLGYQSIEEKKRGISDQKINVACAIDEKKNMIIQVSIPGRITSKSLIGIYEGKIEKRTTVVSDSLRSYHQLMKKLEIDWKKIPSKKKEIDGYTLDKVNHLHSNIKYFLERFRGVSWEYLQGYIEMFKVNEEYKKAKEHDMIQSLIDKVMSLKMPLTCKDIDEKRLNWII